MEEEEKSFEPEYDDEEVDPSTGEEDNKDCTLVKGTNYDFV